MTFFSLILATAVTVVNTADIDSVRERRGTVQDRLIDVRSALRTAEKSAKDGWTLLVKTPGALEDEQLFNDALDHFTMGSVRVCAPEELRAKMDELAAKERKPATVLPDGSKWEHPFWRERCLAKQKEIAANESHVFDCVFLGDSITHNWERETIPNTVYDKFGGFGLENWRTEFKDFRVLNLGIGGDRTQDLLWRLANGELENYKARLFTLMIGTNNVRSNSPEEMAAGVKAILDLVKAKHPEAKIVLYAIFPRGKEAKDGLRAKNEKANALIRSFADGETVIWHDINAKFLEPDGHMEQAMMADYLHPTPKGYGFWSDDVKPLIVEAAKAKLEYPDFRWKKTNVQTLGDTTEAVAKRDAYRERYPDVVPCAPRLHDGRVNYYQNVRGRLAAAGTNVEVVVWGQNKATGLKFEGLKAVGISVGETLEQLPWNALTGDFDGYRAQWIVLGVDQTHERRDRVTLNALRQSLEIIRRKQRKAKVIVLAAAPGGQDADDEMRKFILRHNAWAKELCDGKNVFWCDYSEGFYLPDGKMNPEMLKGEFNFTDKAKAQLEKAIRDTMAGHPPAFATGPAPERDATYLTLMTYNIHSGWGKDGTQWNLGDPLHAIKKVNPDVCTMNEVSWGGRVQGFALDEPTVMGHILNPMWRTAYGKAMESEDGAYGNAILFRDPELRQEVVALPGKKEPRSLVAVEFEKYIVATTHLPLHEEFRLKSVEVIVAWLKKQTKPVFLTGDWNAEPKTATVAELKKHFRILSDESVPTFCTTRPHATIDYIAVDIAHADRVTVESCTVPDFVDGSDHFPIVMKLSLR